MVLCFFSIIVSDDSTEVTICLSIDNSEEFFKSFSVNMSIHMDMDTLDPGHRFDCFFDFNSLSKSNGAKH